LQGSVVKERDGVRAGRHGYIRILFAICQERAGKKINKGSSNASYKRDDKVSALVGYIIGDMVNTRVAAKKVSSGRRAKISTTVAPETIGYLERKVATGEAANVAEALDTAVAAARKLENRMRLAAATSAYFSGLDEKATAEENAIAQRMASAGSGVDFDSEL
jgi:ribosomal protein S5